MPFLVAFLLLIAASAMTYALTPSATKQTPSILSDFSLPVPDEGTPQNIVFGDVWIEDWFVLWYGNFSYQPIYATGGKK